MTPDSSIQAVCCQALTSVAACLVSSQRRLPVDNHIFSTLARCFGAAFCQLICLSLGSLLRIASFASWSVSVLFLKLVYRRICAHSCSLFSNFKDAVAAFDQQHLRLFKGISNSRALNLLFCRQLLALH